MWTIATQSALVNTIVDFTTALSPLLMGLVSVVWLSAGMIVWVALQDFWTQNPQPRAEPTRAQTDHRAAA